MSATATTPAAVAERLARKRRGLAWARTFEGRVGLAILVAVALLVTVGPLFAPYPPNEIGVGVPLATPEGGHLLGTDQLGRDLFSRYLDGGTTIVLVPLAANVLGFLIGGLLGLFGAYQGGRTDAVIARVFDLLIAIPSLLLTLVLIAGLGTSWSTLIFVIAIVTAPRAGRVIRGAAQTVAVNDYVVAARLRGESVWWVLCREILPNASGPIVAIFSLYLTYAIVGVSTLSFLGLGAQPPSSDWGLMVAEGRDVLTINPWATLVPAFSIGLLAIAFTLIADSIDRRTVGNEA
ncbi:MAG TPA: ABC transporter permease [Solirubrobacterales bacterium]|nr:ABC transporter permease [Solirubrobacterales bacterium]